MLKPILMGSAATGFSEAGSAFSAPTKLASMAAFRNRSPVRFIASSHDLLLRHIFLALSNSRRAADRRKLAVGLGHELSASGGVGRAGHDHALADRRGGGAAH